MVTDGDGFTVTVTVADPDVAWVRRANAVPWLFSTLSTLAIEPLMVMVFDETDALAPESPSLAVSVPRLVVTVAVTLDQSTLVESVMSKFEPMPVAISVDAATVDPPVRPG
jgi:hypothetical protein